MSTTPEELCKFIMAKARGEMVEERVGPQAPWMENHGVWSPDWEYRIAPKPKKKIMLYAYVTNSVLKENLLYGYAPVFHPEKNLPGYFRLPALDQEIEVEDE